MAKKFWSWWSHLFARRTCKTHGCGDFYPSNDGKCVVCRLPEA